MPSKGTKQYYIGTKQYYKGLLADFETRANAIDVDCMCFRYEDNIKCSKACANASCKF